ncbi:MAG: SAM-dependent chlorinase/fluorinase [Cyclobacteriaceae bacterium]|nr:SAM-dependent chlorinase/fluorinase [Cyclobacteriaceae bacterium]
MTIITLLTDFGITDHYVASLKAAILSVNPEVTIVDISHNIIRSDIAHASFVLKQCYQDFPEGTIHLVSIGTSGHPEEKIIALNINNHYFIGADNGLLGLISDHEAEQTAEINSTNEFSTFVAKKLMAATAAKIANGIPFKDIGSPIPSYRKMIGRHLRATKKQISGNVIRVDHYGNLITNIDKKVFMALVQERQFSINFGRNKSRKINDYYSQVEPGEYFVLFNDSDLLEIGIYLGNASELLGLEFDSTVMINFEE